LIAVVSVVLVADGLGHDAEYLERQLIDRAPYNPKPDIENVKNSWQSLSKILRGTGGTGPTVNMICNSNPPGRLSVVAKKVFQNHP
jgi:hypothetical protein